MAITVDHKRTRMNAAALNDRRRTVFQRQLKLSAVFSKPIKTAEVIFFTSQISLMLEIGTPLKNALEATLSQTTNPDFKKVIKAILDDIVEGRQLSDALRHHPDVFDSTFVSLVKAGEAGGFLAQTLDRSVEMQEKRQALGVQIRSALTYPMLLCLLGCLVVVFVMVGVLPKFTVFFAGKENLLPLTTRSLMVLSGSLQQYWWVYLLGFIASCIGLILFKHSEYWTALKDWVFIKMPLISGLSNKINTCSLLRTLGHLMESQVPILQALEVTRETVGNRYFRRFIQQIQEHVRQGGKFAQPFSVNPFILESVKQMIATGEEIGDLAKVMLRLARFYDTEVDRQLKAIAAMIEPAALIVMGTIIGVIVSSVILPIFRLSQALQ